MTSEKKVQFILSSNSSNSSDSSDSSYSSDLTLSQHDFRRRWIGRFWIFMLTVISFACIVPLFVILGYVLERGWPGFNWAFLTELPRPMGEEGGGMANAILGSVYLILLASLVGIPWGIGVGIYLAEYKKDRTNKVLRLVVDLLTSVPSIIIGMFAFALFVVPMRGYSAVAGSAALAMIMIPVVARMTEEMFKLMPAATREAGLALGLSRWKVLLRIMLPASLGGVITGVMLAIARIAGETAPLLFTAFSNQYGFRGLLKPVSSLPVQIYTFAISQDDIWQKQAWAGALVLVAFVFIMNIVTRSLLAQLKK